MQESQETKELEVEATYKPVIRKLIKQLENMESGEMLTIEIQMIGGGENEENGREI